MIREDRLSVKLDKSADLHFTHVVNLTGGCGQLSQSQVLKQDQETVNRRGISHGKLFCLNYLFPLCMFTQVKVWQQRGWQLPTSAKYMCWFVYTKTLSTTDICDVIMELIPQHTGYFIFKMELFADVSNDKGHGSFPLLVNWQGFCSEFAKKKLKSVAASSMSTAYPHTQCMQECTITTLI